MVAKHNGRIYSRMVLMSMRTMATMSSTSNPSSNMYGCACVCFTMYTHVGHIHRYVYVRNVFDFWWKIGKLRHSIRHGIGTLFQPSTVTNT